MDHWTISLWLFSSTANHCLLYSSPKNERGYRPRISIRFPLVSAGADTKYILLFPKSRANRVSILWSRGLSEIESIACKRPSSNTASPDIKSAFPSFAIVLRKSMCTLWRNNVVLCLFSLKISFKKTKKDCGLKQTKINAQKYFSKRPRTSTRGTLHSSENF